MNPGGKIHSEHVNCGGWAGQLFPVLESSSKVQMQKSELDFKAGVLRIWDSPRETHISVISGEPVLNSVPASLPTSAPPPALPEAAGVMGHPPPTSWTLWSADSCVFQGNHMLPENRASFSVTSAL